MRVGSQAQRFTRELQALYAAAGSPPYPEIVAYGANQVRQVVFRDATLSDWLAGGGSVPSDARAFAALTALLEQRALQCRPGHVRRRIEEWERLRAAARAERTRGRTRSFGNASGQASPAGALEAPVLGCRLGGAIRWIWRCIRPVPGPGVMQRW